MDITGTVTVTQEDRDVDLSPSGAFYQVTKWGDGCDGARGAYYKYGFQASRTWSGYTSSNGGTEARPIDFTYKIWKRTD